MPSPLQWGHGDEAVEEADVWSSTSSGKRLQWGHGDEAVEELRVGGQWAGRPDLQWGHVDEAVEEAGASGWPSQTPRAPSMGPRR